MMTTLAPPDGVCVIIMTPRTGAFFGGRTASVPRRRRIQPSIVAAGRHAAPLPLNTARRVKSMGRLLSGRHRAMDIANPGSRGNAGRQTRKYVKRDITRTADDMISILRMSSDDKIKEHLGSQIARVVESASGTVRGGGWGAGAAAAADAGAAASSVQPSDNANAGDDDELMDDLEAEIWGDIGKSASGLRHRGA